MFEFIEDAELRQKAIDTHTVEIDNINNTWKDKVTSSVEEATTGLKNKNAELLNEKKNLQETWKGLDPKKARAAVELVETNEDVKLLESGKLAEVIDKHTSKLRSDHESLVGQLQGELNQYKDSMHEYKTKYESKLVDDEIASAALAAKVLPGAVQDILRRGREIFKVTESGDGVEARDKDNKLRKTEDDKILTTKLWIDSLKDESPHYWPQSKGGNLNPGDAGDPDSIDAKILAAANSGNFAEFTRLQELKKKGKK